MFVKFLNAFVATIVALFLVLFAVSNGAQVTLQVWPLPYQISMGLYAVILWAALIGAVGGMIVAWIMGSPRRRELRESRRQVRDLERSLDRHQSPPSKTSGH